MFITRAFANARHKSPSAFVYELQVGKSLIVRFMCRYGPPVPPVLINPRGVPVTEQGVRGPIKKAPEEPGTSLARAAGGVVSRPPITLYPVTLAEAATSSACAIRSRASSYQAK
jgi:hypothetical protein